MKTNKSKLPIVTITGYKTIESPTKINWHDYEISLKEIEGKELLFVSRKDGKGKATYINLEQATSNEIKCNTITETTSGKGIPASILNTGFIKDYEKQ